MSAAAGGRDAEPFPWEAVMHAGFCLLRLSPDVFWRLTPVEFFAMTGGLRPRRLEMARDGLEGLMERFPDEVEFGRGG
ncbi:rcc01693 family protein [Pseudorhizobium flavum]|uniref:rcc01693 family protein n=1 Tax=Pseudorhizobium flavum TaxID=1335061 RepID=UPI00248F8F26|nr:rcc01693 family protein [Pseudorhizobium flavum]